MSRSFKGIFQETPFSDQVSFSNLSMFGAWGDAVSSGPAAGHVLQLRALDWNTDGPFRDYSQITVYHPAPTYGYAFANIGFSGFVGSITGLNEVSHLFKERSGRKLWRGLG